ncbi:MAG: AbiV family abortive infection protein [Labilithrix sp.]|nr:AbiV family abortive infection protein [Labilithrix sp.]
MAESSENWSSSVTAALADGQQIAPSKEEFNLACDHIVQLLRDASALLENGSHATAAFLAVTAIEETSKVHLGHYRRSAKPLARQKDPLFRHAEKHLLAAGPTVAMGERLREAVGERRVDELVALARNGGLVSLREAALYVEQHSSGLRVPAAVIPKVAAREVLLFAIEAFDDALVGYTDHTFALRNETDSLFSRWRSSPSSGRD